MFGNFCVKTFQMLQRNQPSLKDFIQFKLKFNHENSGKVTETKSFPNKFIQNNQKSH